MLLVTVTVSCSLFAQQGEGPTSIIQGTFIGKTIPLRDFPTVSENTVSDPKDIIIVPNNFRANEKLNQDALPLGLDQTAQKILVELRRDLWNRILLVQIVPAPLHQTRQEQLAQITMYIRLTQS